MEEVGEEAGVFSGVRTIHQSNATDRGRCPRKKDGRFEKRPPKWVKEDVPMQCICTAPATWRIVHPRVDGVREQSYACDSHKPPDTEDGEIDFVSLRCGYCEALAGDGHYVCEACDRRMREDVRRRNGYPPFTDAEYRALRTKHGRSRGVLVVNGGRL